MAVLIDTSFLLAAAFDRDANFERVSRALRTLRNETRIVPAPVLNELFYMTMTRMGYQRAVQIFANTRSAFDIEALIDDDMQRMYQIMIQYADNRFDYVDVSIMALAERLNITRICTLDERDFRSFRPSHCAYFDLLPA